MINKKDLNKLHIWEKLDLLEKLLEDRDKLLEELEECQKERAYWKEKANRYEIENKRMKKENEALKHLLKDIKKELDKKPVVKTIVVEKVTEKPVIKEVLKEVKPPVHENKIKEVNRKVTTSFDVKLSQLRRCLDRYA